MLKNLILFAMLGMTLARPQFPPPAQSDAPAPPPGQAGPGGPPPSLHAAPAGNASTATVVKSEFVDDGSGTFRWAFETSDGFKAEQSGQTAPPGQARSGGAPGAPGSEGEDEEGGGETVKGSYSYTAPDGQLISVTYVADKNGFQPVGAHIPTPPPNPHAASGAGAAPAGSGGPAGPGAPSGPGGAPAGPPPNGASFSGSQSFASGPGGPPASAQAGSPPQNPAQG